MLLISLECAPLGKGGAKPKKLSLICARSIGGGKGKERGGEWRWRVMRWCLAPIKGKKKEKKGGKPADRQDPANVRKRRFEISEGKGKRKGKKKRLGAESAS